MVRILLGLVLVLVTLSCSMRSEKKEKKKATDNIVKDGITKVYYGDGKLRAEIPMKNGKRNGVGKEYHPNGKVHLVINYVDGKSQGLVKRYYDNGDLLEETNYDKGEMHGTRKKYEQGGRLSSEATYSRGQPCQGLKEYQSDGKLKTTYPKIVIEEVNNLLKDNRLILRIHMSNNSKSAVFYESKLNGGCLPDGAIKIPSTSKKGISELEFYAPPGTYDMKTISIIGKLKTSKGNYFVTQRSYNLVIENQ